MDGKSSEVKWVRALTCIVAINVLIYVADQICLFPSTAVILFFLFRSCKGDCSFYDQSAAGRSITGTDKKALHND